MEAVLTGLLTKQTPERPAARSPALGWCCLGRRVDPRHLVVAGTVVFPSEVHQLVGERNGV